MELKADGTRCNYSYNDNNNYTGMEIAVIGMAGRFPGASNIDDFWENLKKGVESIPFFSTRELNNTGTGTHFVGSSGGLLDETVKMSFDASFFGYTPLEAEIMDPQMCIFHECCWEALENAGYVSELYEGMIGLYAGASPHFYWEILALVSGKGEALGDFAASQLADKDSLSMKVSFKLDLRGPALTVQTTCSTSLVAIHLACQALLNGECTMALAGGVSAAYTVPQGYDYQEGMIYSVDGHCRAFDARAKGTIPGEGSAVVVLKSLDSAIGKGDHIHAIIKGTAVNNDGIRKIGYTAPSITGQAEVIRLAHRVAEVEPESITYVETHGTGTPLGDPIEVEALTRAFNTGRKRYCAIGSVKTNIGHLDSAAGAASLIKTVLALKHRQIPPSLHFETPNPKIDFENSPFYVNTELQEWKHNGSPLRAGVSSFGIGGTNAHVVLEEAPEAPEAPILENNLYLAGQREAGAGESAAYHLILLSARTPTALERMTKNLAAFFNTYISTWGNQSNPVISGQFLADAAYTLQVGRKAFNYRRSLVAPDIMTAVSILSSEDSGTIKTFSVKESDPAVVFMFSGIGSQYVDMGRQLYEKEPVFREETDRCFGLLKALMDHDIHDMKELLYPGCSGREIIGGPQPTAGPGLINRIEIAQPLLFILEYALAKLLMHWKIEPAAVIGYSFGQYAAACIAGIMSLEDALTLVVSRGQLIAYTSRGAMMSVPLPVEEVEPLLNREIDIAIDNGPSCIVSGSAAVIDALENRLKEKKILCMRLDTDKAIHSTLMDPVLSAFQTRVSQVQLRKPVIPIISNVSGDWLTDAEALEPGYWAAHLRKTVRFARGIQKLLQEPASILIEIGPGRDLCSLVQRHLGAEIDIGPRHRVVDLIRPRQRAVSDLYYLLNQIGRMWLYGKTIDWQLFHWNEKRKRVPLPAYPFAGRPFRLQGDLSKLAAQLLQGNLVAGKKTDIDHWLYVPVWEQSISLPDGLTGVTGAEETATPINWLLFINESPFIAHLLRELQRLGLRVTVVKQDREFSSDGAGQYRINPVKEDDYDRLFSQLSRVNRLPVKILHCWNLSIASGNTGNGEDEITPAAVQQQLDLGFYSVLNIVRAMGRQGIFEKIRLYVITDGIHGVTGQERLSPGKAAVLGAVRGIPLEYKNIGCTGIDVVLPGAGTGTMQEKQLIAQLLAEISATAPDKDDVVAFRGKHRWVPAVKPLHRQDPDLPGNPLPLKEKGVYLITGGSGGIGFTLAQYLAETVSARLVLMGRSLFSPEKMQKIRDLEKTGAEIMVANADVADEQQVKRVVETAITRFGHINGVIHTAGIVDNAGVIQKRTRQDTSEILAAKVTGTLMLDAVLKDQPLDFFAICSSLGSMITPFGQVGYGAANCFIDAFAHYKMLGNVDNGTVIVAINWDLWQEVGMGVRAIKAFEKDKHLTLPVSHRRDLDVKNGILPAEGAVVFHRILRLGYSRRLPQIAVSTRDLNRMLQYRMQPEEEFSHLFETPGNPAAVETLETLELRPLLSSQYVPPEGEIENRLAAIWQKTFGIRGIGVHDDFFELGGDSLIAIVVIAKIHKEFEVEIPLAQFFNGPSIKELAAYIKKSHRDIYSAIQPVETKEYYPLSSAQKRLYVLQQMEKDNVAYNEPQAVLLTGAVDRVRIEKSFQGLINRHEGLRTSIEVIEGTPVQRINPGMEFEIRYDDLTGKGQGNTETEQMIQDIPSYPSSIMAHFIRPFDLARAPLLRVGLLKIAPGKHILMLDTHHIATDALSSEIFLTDLAAFFREKELPHLKLQYKDFSQWQNAFFGTEEFKKQQYYWLKEFSGEIPVLNLPIDYKRPEIFNFAGSAVDFVITEKQTAALRKMALEQGVTLYMLLLAAYTILLGKICSQEEISIGTPTAGRRHADLEQVIGMFANTLALKNFPGKKRNVSEFLREVKARTLMAFENQEYQFETLVDQLQVTRDASRNPVFETVFAFQAGRKKFPLEKEAEDDEVFLKPYEFQRNTAKFELTLTVKEEQNLSCQLEYSTKLFKKTTVERFVSYFERIIVSILKAPEQEISGIEILSEQEKKQLLYLYNDTRAGYPRDKTIHELFKGQADKTPDGVALVGINLTGMTGKNNAPYEYIRYTYRVLDQKANQLARLLMRKIAIPETLVGIMVNPDSSLELISGILGILKAGCAYLPIDPGYPQERSDYMLADSRARFVLIDEVNQTGKRFEGVEVIPVDVNRNDENRETNVFTNRPVQPHHLAYVIYTSGTTGKPKGVMIRHNNVVRLLFNDKNPFTFTTGDVWTMFHSFCFDFSVWEMYGALLYGGKLVVVPRMITRDPSGFLIILKQTGTTVLNQTPSAFYNLIQEELRCKINQLALRCVIFGGEALKPAQLKEWHEKYPAVKLINMYGITETTVHVTYKEIRHEEIETNLSNIGRPLPTLSLYIMDSDQQLLVPGAAGELWVGGDGVGRGYLNRPELTAEKFILATKTLRDNGVYFSLRYNSLVVKLYRSGDLARWLDDGNIEYLGRLDHQIALRGFRIEPGEIDYQLLQHPYITDVITVGRNDENSDKGHTYLCSYFVAGKKLMAGKLREYLSGKLPAFMVPSYFVQLDRIPLTVNGKIDRAALSRQGFAGLDGYVPPENEIQAKLARIWETLLGQKNVGIRNRFFNSGGDSIKAINVLNVINHSFNTQLKIPDIYLNETIEKLANLIGKSKDTKTGVHELALKKAAQQLEALKNRIIEEHNWLQNGNNIEDFYPMSDIEIGIVFHYTRGVDDAVFHDQFVFQVTYQAFNPGLFKKALALMTEKHQILRTSFNLEDFPEPLQMVHKKVSIDMLHVDISRLIPAQQETHIREFLQRDRRQPFDVQTPPMWRMRTFVLGNDNILALWIFHHAILDGWSNASLMTELNNTYLELKENSGYVPAKLESSYKDYILEQMVEKQKIATKEYWQKELEDYKKLVFTGFNDHSHDKNDNNENNDSGIDTVKSVSYDFAAGFLEKIEMVARRFNTSIKNICFGSYVYMLSILSYTNDIVVGLITHNRPVCRDGHKIVGCFLNSVPCRIRIPAGITWGEYIRMIDKKMLELKTYDRLSFLEIVKLLGIKSQGMNPVFDTSFNFVDFHVYNQVRREQFQHITITAPDSNISNTITSPEAQGMNRDMNKNASLSLMGYENLNSLLHFNVGTTFGTLSFEASYKSSVFSDRVIGKICGYFKDILTTICHTPGALMKKSDIMDQEEKNILSRFNDDLEDE